MKMVTTNGPARLALGLALAAALGTSLSAQRPAGSAGDWCADQHWGDDREGFCEVREYTVPAAGATLAVDASPNGGIDVDGSARGDILVQARVIATADTRDEARALASRVQVVATAVRVDAEGPRNLERRQGWHVSYRLAVPTNTPLALKTTNGGIAVDNVNSHVELTTTNGGVKLSRIAGDVTGRTTNGGITVDLEGSAWDGNGLDLQTTNGGVQVRVPADYNAHLEAGTTNGSVKTDFPVLMNGTRNRSFTADLGSGGAPVRVRTSNGGVKITKK